MESSLDGQAQKQWFGIRRYRQYSSKDKRAVQGTRTWMGSAICQIQQTIIAA